MPKVVAFDHIKPESVRRSPGGPDTAAATSFPYFRSTSETPDAPTAFEVRYDAGTKSSAHFHIVDQFQIIINGKGRFGRHDVSPYDVHFSRAHTPYGPLQADKNTGWAFLTLRARYDPGAQRFPAAQEKLKQIADRRPWQITKKFTFPSEASGISLQECDIRDDQGLATWSLTMEAGTRTTAPSHRASNGQYVVAMEGSMIYGGLEHKAPTVAFVKPEEAAFEIHAGTGGLKAFIFNFPQATSHATAIPSETPAIGSGLKKWQCVLCDFYYDEAQGIPLEGLQKGTRWEDVPEDWTCPDCSASKNDFKMVEL